jgi:alpha-amylase/alpha-mannosidase (GH57 family)
VPDPTRFISIHGHFYQPPRENPWLDAVEMQDSAFPYHDWNQRITAECYAPNAWSRILDGRDRITKIINNYSWISFNFGPTLLSWMERQDPRTYASIVEADGLSQERFGGHGSAIAQTYNHMILPLANARDRATQVRWGIRDFEHRFGRKPEGMWLAETAVDVPSLEALAAEGILFTIMEPHQARRWRPVGESEWRDAGGGVNPTLPYLCNLPSGRSIAVFFYDGPISRAVAFEKLLTRGELFAHRLLNAFSESKSDPQLVNIATDGETYGHHHRFGDMALAFAIDYIERNGYAKMTNYAEHLARVPPVREVELFENTSWSCAHGIERWRSDCGCNTGVPAGWTQAWRKPLREALNWLRDEAAAVYESAAHGLLHDPWAARDAYVNVILERNAARARGERNLGRLDAVDAFLAIHAGDELNEIQTVRVLELLEMQHNAMLMFTSCGWFFNDISGIETVQVLHYAGRVTQLAEKLSGRSLTPELLTRLAPARSNIHGRGDARSIYENEVIPTMLDLQRVGAHYAVASLFDVYPPNEPVYCYDVERIDHEALKSGRTRLALGTIRLTSHITRESATFHYGALHLGEVDLTGGLREVPPPEELEAIKSDLRASMERADTPGTIRLLDTHFGTLTFSIKSLFRDEQRQILELLCDATLAEAEAAFRQIHDRYDPLMRLHAALGIPLPKVLQLAAELDLNLQLRRLLPYANLPVTQIEALVKEAKHERVALDETTLLAFKETLERLARRFAEVPEDLGALEQFEAAAALVKSMEIGVDIREPQNIYYRLLQTVHPAMAARAAEGDAEARQWIQHFAAVGELLGVAGA